MSRELYDMVYKVVNGDDSEAVSRFMRENKDYLFYKGNSTEPVFYLDTNPDGEISLFRRYKSEPKEVIHVDKAREIITRMHRSNEGRPCNPKGINALTRHFCQRYYIHGAQQLITQIKNECTGTCKITKTLNVLEPPPKAIHTSTVMERVQIDLMHLYGEKSPFREVATHRYKYVLSIMDCFSKYCWLAPLSAKTANCVSTALFSVFNEFGCPKVLQSDNGGEFVNHVISSLCQKLHITIKHGRPYHPQSQGQVESLNKRVKRVLISQLLQYQPSDQVNIWPYLLPHVAHYLNNTWHLTIQDTPFKVFFGRASGNLGQNSAAQMCGILPDDSTFMTMIPCTPCEVSEGLHLCSSSELQPYAVEEVTEEDMHDICRTSADYAIAPSLTIEDMRNLSTLDRIRYDIECSILENTERKNVRTKLLYLKHARLHKFCTGQEIFFKKSMQIGLVSVSTTRGRVEKTLAGDFYEVSYTVNEHEHRCTLSAAQMTSTSCAGLSTGVCNDRGDVATTEGVLQQLQQTANSMRQRFCRRCIEKSRSGSRSENVYKILAEVGIPEIDAGDPNNLTDILAYALDLAVIATVQRSTAEFHQQCSTYSEALLSFLLCKNFSFFASGIYLWEQSRFQNVHPILASLESQQLPSFVGAQHKCWECVLSQDPCSHPCCKVWYVDSGLKCGYLTTDGPIIGTSIDSYSTEDQPHHGESHANDHNQSFGTSDDTQDLTGSGQLQQSESSSTIYQDPNISFDLLSSRRKLRPVCSRGTYEALVSRPSVMSKSRLQALLNALRKSKSLCSGALLSFHSKCEEVIELWDHLPKKDRASLSQNIQYAVSIIGKHASPPTLQNIRVVSSDPFMQVQGSSAWCGLCALNNAAGTEAFTPLFLDEVSDNIWLRLFEDIGSTLLDYYEPIRSIDGDYSIEVLMQAAELKGYTLTYMNNFVHDFLLTCDATDKSKWPEFSRLSGSDKVMILRHETSHYSTINIRGGKIWHLDSKNRKPSELSNLEFISLLGPLRTRATRASIFSFTKQDYADNLPCLESMPSPTEQSSREDESLPTSMPSSTVLISSEDESLPTLTG